MSATVYKPYRVRPTGKSLGRVLDEVHAQMYVAYGPDDRHGTDRIHANPLGAYERFLATLRDRPQFRFVRLRDLFAAPRPSDGVQVAIRHDLDMDLGAALPMAQVEARLGVRSTYYVLHTAPYYGTFSGDAFHRHDAVRHAFREMQDRGHEIGLHADALRVYMDEGMDGAQALTTELAWLREGGLDVVGSAAHNDFRTYGTENWEIFTGRTRQGWEPAAPGDRKTDAAICYGGRCAPLHVLDESALGLVYEANDAFRYGDGPVEYGATRGPNLWRWNPHIRRWEAGGRRPPDQYFCDEDRVLRDILALPEGTLLLLTVHPVYYGCRYRPDRSPPLRRQEVRTAVHPDIGWETYRPETVQCFPPTDGDGRQTITWANELGMLDAPWPTREDADAWRVLVLGGAALDGRRITRDAQCHRLLQARLAEGLSNAGVVRKLAFPGMGISRLWAWYRDAGRQLAPDVVVLGIGGDVLRVNLPRAWARATGYSLTHPPGDYLDWDPEARAVRTVSRSQAWAIHQMQPREAWHDPATGTDLDLAFAGEPPREGAHADLPDNVKRLYGHVCERIRADGGRPILLVETLGTRPGDRGRAPVAAGTEAAGRAQARLAGLARSLDTPLVDPYTAFAEADADLPATDATGLWTHTGHRLAAECLYHALAPLLTDGRTRRKP